MRLTACDGIVAAPLSVVRMVELPKASFGRPLIFSCTSGNRTGSNALLPEQPARGPAHTLEGGREAWEKADLPVACGRKESLERQVRMVAGSIILCGRVLSLAHGAFPVLPIGAGCGLVFCWCDRGLRHVRQFQAEDCLSCLTPQDRSVLSGLWCRALFLGGCSSVRHSKVSGSSPVRTARISETLFRISDGSVFCTLAQVALPAACAGECWRGTACCACMMPQAGALPERGRQVLRMFGFLFVVQSPVSGQAVSRRRALLQRPVQNALAV